MNDTNKERTDKMISKEPPSSTKYPYNGLLIGFFWVIAGTLILLNNFKILTNGVVLFLLFILSIYLIFLSVLHIVRKLYFVLGLLLLTAFTSSLAYLYEQNKIIWPTVMGLISIGIIVYGFVFKPHNKIKYIIPGVSLIIIGILVFFTAVGDGVFKISRFLYNAWPLLLIILGFYNVKMSAHNKSLSKDIKTRKKKKEQPNIDTNN